MYVLFKQSVRLAGGLCGWLVCSERKVMLVGVLFIDGCL
jgi:hypothetical protein